MRTWLHASASAAAAKRTSTPIIDYYDFSIHLCLILIDAMSECIRCVLVFSFTCASLKEPKLFVSLADWILRWRNMERFGRKRNIGRSWIRIASIQFGCMIKKTLGRVLNRINRFHQYSNRPQRVSCRFLIRLILVKLNYKIVIGERFFPDFFSFPDFNRKTINKLFAVRT